MDNLVPMEILKGKNNVRNEEFGLSLVEKLAIS